MTDALLIYLIILIALMYFRERWYLKELKEVRRFFERMRAIDRKHAERLEEKL